MEPLAIPRLERARPPRPALVLVPVVVLLAGALPARAADPPYPRLGLYGHVDGRGGPIVRANGTLDATLLDQVARHHTVVLDASPFTEYRPDALSALRQRRADLTLLAYVQGAYIFPSAQADSTVNLPTRLRILVRNLSGFLYDRDGTEFRNANINLAKKNAQGRYVVAEAMADFFVDQVLVPGGWNGLYLDRFCTSIAWDQAPGDSIDFARAGYPSLASFDQAWITATDTLAHRLRRRAGNAPVLVGNCATGNKYASFNGWMREAFPHQGGGTWQANVFGDPGGYLTDQARFRAPYHGWLTAWPANVADPYEPEARRQARFALGTAALGEGYGTMNPPDLDPTTGYLGWWHDEYAVDRWSGQSSPSIANTGWLGRPRGAWTRMVWAQAGVEDACDQNPGFETSVSTGWTFLATNGAAVSPSLQGRVGLFSAQIHVPTAAGGASAVRYRTIGDVFYIADTYSATFWAKASAPRTIEVAAVSTADGHTFNAAVESLSTAWTRHQVLFTGQFGFARLELRFGGKVGDVWIDDVHFQRGAPFVYRRDFDYGAVLVNAGSAAFDVQMERSFRRIAGLRDPQVNDGSQGALVHVASGDAVFLLSAREDLVDVAPGPGRGPATGPALQWTSVAPNPSPAGSAAVRLALVSPGDAAATVDLYDAAGRVVRRLHRGPLAPGGHAFAWDGRDDSGRAVPPGLYFARATIGATRAVRKVVRAG